MERVEAKKPFNFKGWYIVIISALMGCSISAGFPQFSMTIVQLEEKLGISQDLLLLGDTVKSAAIVLAMMAAGFAYKKVGARKTFIFALVLLVVTQFLMPHNSSVVLFFILKVAQGFSALVFPIFLILIMDAIDEKDTGFATALFNGIFYGGGGIGGTLAGIVIAQRGWLDSFYALGILELIIGVIWLLTVRPVKKSAPELAEGEAPKEAISTKKLLSMPQVWLLILAFFSTTFVLQAVTVDMPIFGNFLGYNDMEVGTAMTAVTIGMVISCLISGKISDFFARGKLNKARARVTILMMGPLIIILSVVFVVVMDLSAFAMFYAMVFLVSFGAAWGLGTFYCVLPEIFDDETLPIVTGLSGGIGDLGMPLAPAIVGVVFGMRGLWTLGWLSCAVLALVSLVACILLLKRLSRKASA